VFVRSRKEHNVITGKTFVARHRVSRNGAIAMADVELIARIIDRRGDIKFFVHWIFILSLTLLRMGKSGIFFMVL
jgi:hypothetical protein